MEEIMEPSNINNSSDYIPERQEINSLQNQLKRIKEIEQEQELLRKRKRTLNETLKQTKTEIEKFIDTNNVKRVKSEAIGLVFSVSQGQYNRKPTLEDTYQAIQNILGSTELEKVKKQVDKLRKERKEKAIYDSSIWIRKVGKKRKSRKDKGVIKGHRPVDSSKQNKKQSAQTVKRIRFKPI